MKRKIFPFLLILALIATLGSTSVSARTSMSKVEGVLQSIHAKTHTLTLQVGSQNKNYTFGKSTLFRNGNKRTYPLDLKAGEKVSIEADSKNFAHRVEVLPSNSQQ